MIEQLTLAAARMIPGGDIGLTAVLALVAVGLVIASIRMIRTGRAILGALATLMSMAQIYGTSQAMAVTVMAMRGLG